MSFTLTLLEPSRLVLSETVESVTLPGASGELTVLSNHTHILTVLKTGDIKIITKDKDGNLQTKSIKITGGIAEVSRKGILTVFT